MESEEFGEMVRAKKTRTKFINHGIKFLRHYGFDGIDLGILN
jgi:GH18 family chitinase